MSYFRLDSRGGRFYADLSPYGGPTLKALIPDNERRATTDPDVARNLYDRWVRYYLDDQKRRHLGLTRNVSLGDAARRWLADRVGERDAKSVTLEIYADLLERVILPEFGARTPLGQIDVSRVRRFMRERRKLLSASTVNRELTVLSQVFRWALEEEIVLVNPVALVRKPRPAPPRAAFLEPPVAWALLEAAGRYRAIPYARALVGMMLYCGLRLDEARGLEGRDVDRKGMRVHVRDNRFRSYQGGGIKQRASLRTVPLWPDLLEWLPDRIGAAPLFPSPKHPDRPLSMNVGKTLGRIARRAKIEQPVTPHVLRHTWCAMRLQTLDGGAPISEFQVMKEGGWTSTKMIHQIYGHLPRTRLRLEVLTYRPEAWQTAEEREEEEANG